MVQGDLSVYMSDVEQLMCNLCL